MTAINAQQEIGSMSDRTYSSICADPDLMAPRDARPAGPECPNCGHFSTRISRARFWCANARCDAVFAIAGLAGLAVVGWVVRSAGMPAAIMPVERVRPLGARLDEPLGESAPISTDHMAWHPLRIEAGRESSVRDDIGMMMLATYSPIRLTWRRVRRLKRGSIYEPVERPLFPGYLFLGAWHGYAVDWLALRAVKHVIGPVIASTGAPSSIAGEVIRSLIHREVAGEFRDAAPDAPKPSRKDRRQSVAVGDVVTIGATEYRDTIVSIEGIYAALARSGMKVHLDSLQKAS